MENYDEIVPRFVGALGYLALAAIAWLARRQRGILRDEAWLSLGGLALAAAQAVAIVATMCGGAPIWNVLRLCLYGAVLGTLAEYGRLVQVSQPKLSVGRTAVAILFVATVPAVLSGKAVWLEAVVRLMIAWQAGLIAGPRVLNSWRATQGRNLAAYLQLTAVGLVYLAAVLPAPVGLVATVTISAAAAAWFVCRASVSETQRVSFFWRWHGPVLFLLLLVAGSVALHRSIVVPAGISLDEIEVAAEPQDFEPGPLDRQITAGVTTQLMRCGLAMFSLLALLVVVILLSRVPGLR